MDWGQGGAEVGECGGRDEEVPGGVDVQEDREQPDGAEDDDNCIHGVEGVSGGVEVPSRLVRGVELRRGDCIRADGSDVCHLRLLVTSTWRVLPSESSPNGSVAVYF